MKMGKFNIFISFPALFPPSKCGTSVEKNMREAGMYEPIVSNSILLFSSFSLIGPQVKGARLFVNPKRNEKSGFVDTHSAKDSVRDNISPDIMNYSRWITASGLKVDLSNGLYFIEAKTGKSFEKREDFRSRSRLPPRGHRRLEDDHSRSDSQLPLLVPSSTLTSSVSSSWAVAQDFFARILPLSS